MFGELLFSFDSLKLGISYKVKLGISYKVKKQPFGCISKVHVKNRTALKPILAGTAAVRIKKESSRLWRRPKFSFLIYTRTIYTP